MIYKISPPHERLNAFFGEFFREMRKAPPQAYENFLMQAEEEFRRTGYREKISSGVENILIIRLDAIGDMILTSGFLREVRANFPLARITLIVSPIVAPMVEFCPYINEVLIFDSKKLNRNFPAMLETLAVFCRDNLWKKNFSIAFSIQWGFDSLPALLICWLSGARERIGFGVYPYESWLGKPKPEESARDNFFLTRNVITPLNIISEIEKCFYLLAVSGLKITKTHLELFYSAEDFRYARDLMEDFPKSTKKVALGIGASAPTKKYPVDKYLIALKQLVKKDLVFVLVAGKGEINDAKFIEENLPYGKVLNLVGKTTIRETEAIISQTDFYLGNDTGTLHMAAAAHVPVIGIYRGAADKENVLPAVFSESQRFPPWQTKAVILRPDHQLEECANHSPRYGWCYADKPHCITQVTPQEIIDAFEVLETL